MSLTPTINALKTSIASFSGSVGTRIRSLEDDKVSKVPGKGLSENDYTDAEKAKLAGLESSKFLGTYTSLAALQSAHPSPAEGSYGDVDSGSGDNVDRYIWDSNDNKFVVQSGAVSGETSASIKSKYEANPDTNAYTNAEKAKLAGIPGDIEAQLIASFDSLTTQFNTSTSSIQSA